MNAAPLNLLKLLGSGIRPEGASQAAPTPSIDAKSFASLLADVKAGAMSSGLPVTVGPHANCDLTASQLERLAVVADAAEAAGATRVAAMMDGQILTLDVLNRTVESVRSASGGHVTTNVDGFVIVPQDVGADASALFGGKPGTAQATDGQTTGALGLIRNRSVAELLSGLSGGAVG